MDDYLPETLTFEAVLEIDPRSTKVRSAPADGLVVDVLLSSGSLVDRGTPVLNITSQAYLDAQEAFIKVISEHDRSNASSDELAAKEKALAGLKFAESQILSIRANRRVIHPIPVLSPFDALLVDTAPAKTAFAAGAPLFSLAAGQLIKIQIDGKWAEYLRKDKEAKIVTADGTQLSARFELLEDDEQKNMRKAQLVTENAARFIGQHVQIEFRFAPWERATPTCTIADWVYPTLPRGSDYLRLKQLHARKTGVALPQASPRHPTAGPATRPAVASFLSSRPTRPVAHYLNPDLQPAPPSKRYSLYVSRTQFSELRISTFKIIRTPITPRWRCSAQVVEYIPPEQPSHISAPCAGLFFPEPIRPRDVVETGKLIGTIQLAESSIADQQSILGKVELSARASADVNLRAIGFVDRDFETIDRHQAPITNRKIYTNSSGVVLECDTHQRNVLPGETVLRIQCTNMHLVRARLPLEEYEKLPPVVQADLWRLSRTNTPPLYSRSTVLLERSRKSGSVEFEVSFAVDKERLIPGHALELELSDPANARQGLCIPPDCIVKLGASNEVLIHSKGGIFTPAPIAIGKRHSELVELLDGIPENSFLVRDLEALSHSSPEIRAIMTGFWKPPLVSVGLA